MQKDFHYFATCCAAMLAGWSPDESLEIATCAQMVDLCSATFLAKVKGPKSAVTTQLQLELMQCQNNYNEAQTELQLCQHSLEQAKENMRLTRKQYDVGLEPLSELLDAQALWQSCSANLVEARCQLQLAETKLLKAAGQLK